MSKPQPEVRVQLTAKVFRGKKEVQHETVEVVLPPEHQGCVRTALHALATALKKDAKVEPKSNESHHD